MPGTSSVESTVKFLASSAPGVIEECKMSEETPDFDPNGGTALEFTHNSHRVEIVPPDTVHLIANYWQIKIDGALHRHLLFSSSRAAAEGARILIDKMD
jgi:hypothetical protein